MRVWVTRPEGLAEKTAQRLRELGMSPWVQPVMHIQPLAQADEVQAVQQRLSHLSRYHGVIFISQNAVIHAADWVRRSWPQWPPHVKAFAIGSATHRKMNALIGGGDPASIFMNDVENAADIIDVNGVVEPNVVVGSNVASASAMNSEALLEHPWMQHVAQKKVLIFRGKGGRHYLKETLEARGASVDYCELYCRSADPNAAMALSHRHAIRPSDGLPCDGLLAYSGESAEYLAQTLKAANETALFHCPLVVPGARVAAMAKALGFTAVHTAINATDDAMLRCLSALNA